MLNNYREKGYKKLTLTNLVDSQVAMSQHSLLCFEHAGLNVFALVFITIPLLLSIFFSCKFFALYYKEQTESNIKSVKLNRFAIGLAIFISIGTICALFMIWSIPILCLSNTINQLQLQALSGLIGIIWPVFIMFINTGNIFKSIIYCI